MILKKINKKIFVSALFLLLFLILSVVPYAKKINEKAEVVFLDVGQGDAILIQDNDLQILIDGGRGRTVLNELGKFMPFGDRKIDFMIITHPDEDHMGGLLEIMGSYQVGHVMESGVACEKDICQKWDNLIAEKNIPVTYARFGQEIILEDIKMSVLYPFEDLKDVEMKELNDSSLVMKADIGGRTYLLTGDASETVEESLLQNNINLKADVLKVSHHGSKNSSTYEFLEAVSPKQAVISVGENSYGHPSEEILNRFQNMNAKIFRTDEMGSVEF